MLCLKLWRDHPLEIYQGGKYMGMLKISPKNNVKSILIDIEAEKSLIFLRKNAKEKKTCQK